MYFFFWPRTCAPQTLGIQYHVLIVLNQTGYQKPVPIIFTTKNHRGEDFSESTPCYNTTNNHREEGFSESTPRA
jgi:hypothetical protein